MRISELKRTVDFVKESVIDAKVPSRFEQLIDILGQNAQTYQGQQPQPITEQKAKLIAAIKAIRPERLTLNERRLLKSLIDTDLMGDAGVAKVNQIFTDHNLDPIGAVNAFTAMMNQYDQLASSATGILKVLAPIDVSAVETDIEEGHAVLQVTFKERAAITNVAEWREYTDQWWKIIRHFGLLTDTTADQAKILSIQEGSIILEISAVYVLVKAIGLAADKILNVIERLYELRRTSREITRLDLTNKQIEKDLQKEADTFIENNLGQITQQVIAEINKSKAREGEVKSSLQISIKDLFDFLDRGGTVDCRLKLTEGESGAPKELQAIFGQIRALETRVEELKLLTDGKDKPH